MDLAGRYFGYFVKLNTNYCRDKVLEICFVRWDDQERERERENWKGSIVITSWYSETFPKRWQFSSIISDLSLSFLPRRCRQLADRSNTFNFWHTTCSFIRRLVTRKREKERERLDFDLALRRESIVPRLKRRKNTSTWSVQEEEEEEEEEEKEETRGRGRLVGKERERRYSSRRKLENGRGVEGCRVYRCLIGMGSRYEAARRADEGAPLRLSSSLEEAGPRVLSIFFSFSFYPSSSRRDSARCSGSPSATRVSVTGGGP